MTPTPPDSPSGRATLPLLDWTRVATDHDAIVISPWLGDALAADPGRTRWYERWDCAGAAILHPRTIARLGKPLRRTMDERLEDAAQGGGCAALNKPT